MSEPPSRTALEATDFDWIQATLQGNPDAFGNLINKYHSNFLKMALRLLKSQEEAEDVLQDAFMAAYRNLSKFQNKAKFSTWFYSIVFNHIQNRLRHRNVLRWVPIDGDEDRDENKPLVLPDNQVPFEVSLEQKIELEDIKSGIKALPVQYQSIFILHYFEGKNLEQISRLTSRPIGTIKSDLHRARKQLLKVLNHR